MLAATGRGRAGRDDYAALIRWIANRAPAGTGVDADDLKQATAYKIVAYGSPPRDRRSYVAAVARNEVARAIARRNRRLDLERVAARPVRHRESPAVLIDVGEAVARLPDQLREAVVATYWLGMDSIEAGLFFGVHRYTVLNRLVRARRILAVDLVAYRPEQE